MSRVSGTFFTINMVATFVASLTITPPSHAQEDLLPPGFEEAMRQDFIRGDMSNFYEGLSLTEAQWSIAQELFRDYEEAFQRGSEGIRNAMNQLRPGVAGDSNSEERQALLDRLDAISEEVEEKREVYTEQQMRVLYGERKLEILEIRDRLRALGSDPIDNTTANELREELAKKVDAWNAQRNSLRDDFLSNLQAILDEDQIGQWPALDRQFTREKTLPRGRLSGESTDLFHIVQGFRFSLAEEEAVDRLLEEYAIMLDVVLRERNDYLSASARDLHVALRESDTGRATSIIERQIQLRLAIRRVNDEYAEKIASLLSEKLGREFMKAYMDRAYRRVFRGTYVDRMFKAAMELKDVTASKAQEVAKLYDQYQSEVEAANERILQLMRIHEPAEVMEKIMKPYQDRPDLPMQASVPIQSAMTGRDQIDRKYMVQLEAILGSDVLKSLPHMPGQNMGAGMEAGDDGTESIEGTK